MKPTYIKLKAVFQELHYDAEDEKMSSVLGTQYQPDTVITEGYEYVLVSGNTQIRKFYSDGEGGVTADTGSDYIAYQITIKSFLNKLKYHIEIIE